MFKRKKTSYGLKVLQQSARRRIILIRIIVAPQDTLKQSIEKTMLIFRSDSPLNIQSTEIWSSQNIFEKLIWRFYPGVHSCRQESVWSSGGYIYFCFGAIFKSCLNLAKYHGSP